MLKELVLKNRTYRRFYQEEKVSKEELLELIDLARISSSAANLQPLKYILSTENAKNEKVFSNIKWAGYLKDWNGPEEGEKPSAYIVMLSDSDISKNIFWDHGIAVQSILLGATEKGYGGCQFGAIDKVGLKRELEIPEKYEIVMVIALGKPKEVVVLEELDKNRGIKYYRDEDGVHHVPKRKLEDLLLDI